MLTQIVKYIAYNCEDPSLDPQHPLEIQALRYTPIISAQGRKKIEGFLARQLTQLVSSRFSRRPYHRK